MHTYEDLKNRLADYPRVPLTHLPTPLQEISRPPGSLGGVRLSIKRDDLTGLGFGGNKARKLEFIVADAVASGADTIITWGGLQSNWCLQTAAAASRVGLRAVIVLLKKAGAPQDNNGNLLLDHLSGAAVRFVEIDADRGFLELADVADLLDPVIEEEIAAQRSPYLAPIGGSLIEGSMKKPLGAMGYTAAFVEMMEQADALGMSIDTVVHPSGSAGTQAGLVAAAKAVAPETRVIGISVAADRETLKGHVGHLAGELLGALSIDQAIVDDDVIVFDDFLGPGYGVLTREISRGIADLARSEGIFLDPVYTGKAWVGLNGLTEIGYIRPEETVVFIHTGGTPALFAYRDQLVGFLPD